MESREDVPKPPTLAFYTCYFGDCPSYITNVPSTEHDCYYFTNNRILYNSLDNSLWKRIWCPQIELYSDFNQNTMECKEIRCCPERFAELQQYDYTCCIDCGLVVNNWQAFEAMWKTLQLNPVACIAMTAHPVHYDTVWGEYDVAMQFPRYQVQQEQYKRYIERQLTLPYANVNLGNRVCAGFRVHKMNARRKEIGECWLDHIHECGIEDQISFQFVHQLFEQEIIVFPYQYCWTYM